MTNDFTLQLTPHPVGLLLQREHTRGQPSRQSQPPPLLVCEPHPVIETRSGQSDGDVRWSSHFTSIMS